MKIPIFQVDAFTRRAFSGNPAAVCPLEAWIPDGLMQRIAAENNLSETAFFVRRDAVIELRWFTPATEVDLCGHATLATAYVLWNRLGETADRLTFATRSGALEVERWEERIALRFPRIDAAPDPAPPPALAAGLGAPPETVLRFGGGPGAGGRLALYENEDRIRSLTPDMRILRELDAPSIIVTAPGGGEVDFVSRFFAPGLGIDEDPVTGAAHCVLTPFWAARLGRERLQARQVSPRGGELECRLEPGYVRLIGEAAGYLEGELNFEW